MSTDSERGRGMRKENTGWKEDNTILGVIF